MPARRALRRGRVVGRPDARNPRRHVPRRRVRPGLLADFLRPLDRALPSPFLRRPVLFHQMNEVMRNCVAQAPAGTLAAAFRDLPNGPEELRVAVSAGYDTTAHTLAFLLSHVAQQPELLAPERRSSVVNEVLRLYSSPEICAPALASPSPRRVPCTWS